MRILYPDDPLDPRQADDLFLPECEVARARGFDVSLFSFEDFQRGRFNARPQLCAGEAALYRGWMLNLSEYQRLTQAFQSLGVRPIVSVESYRAAHHLPRWYPLVKEWSAETLIFDAETNFETALTPVNWPGYFVKDYVKSLNTGPGSLVTHANEIAHVIAQLKKYRGEIEGGVCLRCPEEYMPGSERRYFVAGGQAFSANGDVPDLVASCAARIPSPFFSVDVARRSDGVPRIVEIGDGQVSDRKEWSAQQLVEVLLGVSSYASKQIDAE
jgi:hypothetical protein